MVKYSLIVENLEKIYKTEVETIAVRDFNLQMKEGEITTLAGPSGSGKTTILMCIASLLEPTFGKIIVNGKIINTLSLEDLIKYRQNTVGIIFQSYNHIDYMTIYENIAFPLWLAKKPKKEIKKRVTFLLENLEISRYAQTYPHFLSAGEQQRLAIAVALANDPQIILADEPTGNLDRSTADIVVNLLIGEVEEFNKILILATHDEKIIKRSKNVISLQKRAY
ncbi:Methionine import ATP-binding protein MetN [subsurface metagenome]|jgi:putative ABC transport system ATP-binding protein